MTAIRICPERDAECPHGSDCPFSIDRYTCRDEAAPASENTKPVSYAAVYAAIYPKLVEIARDHGYALAIHGSVQRDFDLVCIPWAETVSPVMAVIEAFTNAFALTQIGTLELKEHGRLVITLSFVGECYIDLSFANILDFEHAGLAEGLQTFLRLFDLNLHGEKEDQLEGLPDSHLWSLCWHDDDESLAFEDGTVQPTATTGQIRKARAAYTSFLTRAVERQK